MAGTVPAEGDAEAFRKAYSGKPAPVVTVKPAAPAAAAGGDAAAFRAAYKGSAAPAGDGDAAAFAAAYKGAKPQPKPVVKKPRSPGVKGEVEGLLDELFSASDKQDAARLRVAQQNERMRPPKPIRPAPGARPGELRKPSEAEYVQAQKDAKAADAAWLKGNPKDPKVRISKAIRRAEPVVNFALESFAPNLKHALDHEGGSTALEVAFVKDFVLMRTAGLASKHASGAFTLTKAGQKWLASEKVAGPVKAFLMRRFNPGSVAGGAAGAGVAQAGTNAATGRPLLEKVPEAMGAGVAGHGVLGGLREVVPAVKHLVRGRKKSTAVPKSTGEASVLPEGPVAMAAGGDPRRLVREGKYIFQTAPNYLRALGDGGKVLAGDVEQLAKKQGDLVELRMDADRLWGPGHVKLHDALEAIGKKSSPGEAERVRKFILGDVLKDPDWVPRPTVGRKVAEGVQTYQAVSKLGLRPITALRNWSQRFTNSGIEHGPLPVVQAQAEMMAKPWREASKKLWKQAENAGVFQSEDASRGPRSKLTDALLLGFGQAETGNRFVAARVRQLGLERDLELLTKLETEAPAVRRLKAVLSLGARTEGAAVRRFERSGLTAARVHDVVKSGGSLTPDEIQEAMQRAVRDEQFGMDLVSSPMWWENSPVLRVAGQFKGFAVKQWKLVHEAVLKEAGKGNLAPLARYIGATLIAGEVYNGARDLVFTGDRSVTGYLVGRGEKEEDPETEALGRRLLHNFQSGGGLGIASDFVFGNGPDETWKQVYQVFNEVGPEEAGSKAKRVVKQQLGGLLGGPSLRTGQNLRDTARGLRADDDLELAPGRLVDLLKKEVPAARDFGGLRRQLKRVLDE